MTITPDLHPDDATHRRQLIAALRTMRIEAGLRHSDVAAILYVQPDGVGKFECRKQPNPHIATVQRHARALGHIADLVLHDIVAPSTADIRTYAAVSTSVNPTIADAATRSLCIARLTAARRHHRLPRSAVAPRMDIDGATLHQIETEEYDPLLSTYQRYARALGGRLTVALRPVGALERAAAA